MKTDFNEFIEFQLRNGKPFDPNAETFQFVLKTINKAEEESGKLIKDFTPNETLDLLLGYSKATIRNIRPFLIKYFNYCVIVGLMNVNYLLMDNRFSLSELSYNTKMEYITNKDFDCILKRYEGEQKAIIYGCWMGFEIADLAILRKSMINRKTLEVTLPDRVVEIDKTYLKILDEMDRIGIRCRGKYKYDLYTFKDYVFKYVQVKLDLDKFATEPEREEAFIKNQKRSLRKLVQLKEEVGLKFTVRDLRASGVINYLCDRCEKSDFVNPINEEKIARVLRRKGITSTGWWFLRTYRLQIMQYYKGIE